MATPSRESLEAVYRDLHAHPELSGQEVRTAACVAGWLAEHGFEVTERVGGTGVVGVLRNGDGPTVALRADMDALPVVEATGLSYASVEDGVMHACGHDVHVACLMGAAAELAATRDAWRGTVVALFQPAEETASGASAMVADGVFDRAPRPVVVLGQHVAPLPAGVLGLRAGASFAATDSLRIRLYGRGGHGSRPEATVDPVVMAASTVLRLQTVVSREVAGTDTVVLTVGALNAGSKSNIIPDDAELLVNIRTYDTAVRARVLDAVDRIVRGEAVAAGAPREPEVEVFETAPAVINDPAATAHVHGVLESVAGVGRIVDPGPVTGSEDVGLLALAADAPLVFWLLGGADPALFAGAGSVEEMTRVLVDLPSNHSPAFAPVPSPTLGIGVDALVAVARSYLR